MTNLSPIQSTGRLVSNLQKGSTYGAQTQIWSYRHSFQQQQRDDRYNNSNGIKVLYSQTTIYSLQQGSIILVCEQTRDPAITRGS